MSDPFEVVQEEARLGLLEISAQLQRWQDLRQSSAAADVAEATKIKTSIKRTLAELNLDLDDLESTVNIAARDPTKYSLTAADIDTRRKFVVGMKSDAASMQAELDADSSSPTPAKKKGERQGLLGGCSSSSEPAEPAEPMNSKGWAVRKENSNMLQAQQQLHNEQLEMQDIELGGLGETVDRLGKMGRTMNEELKAQGRAFDEFTQEVESTRDRMHAAVATMNKMMKNKDRGKFCAIGVLTIVLFLLMYAVFS